MEGGGLVAVILGLVIGVILIVAVGMPIINQTLYVNFSTNGTSIPVFSGMTQTILTYLLPFMALGALVMVAKAVIGY